MLRITNSLALLQASEHLGVLRASPERIIDANDAFLKMAGLTRAEMDAGKVDWRAMTPDEYRSVDEGSLQELRTHGACVPYEKEYLLPDGTRLPVLLGAVRLSSDPLEWLCWVVNLRATKEVARAEQHSRELQLQLDAELKGAYRIHEISTRLLAKSSVEEVLNEILDAAIEVTEADFGNIQLLDQGLLRIVTQRGFSKEFLDFFDGVSHDSTAVCGAALSSRYRVIVEDVRSDELFRGTSARGILLRAGVLAVQSTPLVGTSGEVYGMLSTHFLRSHRPNERALRYLDLLAIQAGHALERVQYAEIESRDQRLRASAQLAASLAHEINNPVQALTNILMLLSQDDAVAAEQQHLVQMAREQLSRVSETLKDILAVDFDRARQPIVELANLLEHMRVGRSLSVQPEDKTE
jgi:PAS domain S-box-containing protein